MRLAAWCLCCAATLALPASASAWSPLRGENSNAKRGNALMAQEQYGPALEAYDEAARELPDARAVQLNRGLALLAQDLGPTPGKGTRLRNRKNTNKRRHSFVKQPTRSNEPSACAPGTATQHGTSSTP
ncbi:MAG: hypothetical protein JRG70_00530 [Deltaproteobacteria bacterium]|nr:hypothetical protein [Deltaproteobacteria bacterium]